MRTRWVTVMAGALVLGAAPVATARDFCFLDNLGLPPLVAKNFSPPAMGQCARFTGSFQDGVFVASGITCGSVDVDVVNFKLVVDAPLEGEKVSYTFFVDRQTMTGEGTIYCVPAECGVVFGIPVGSLPFSIHEVACKPN